jgi:hypothetical protein
MRIKATPLDSGGWRIEGLDSNRENFEGRYYEESKREATDRFRADLRAHNQRNNQRNKQRQAALKAEISMACAGSVWADSEHELFL